ncbi:hypothetical protein BpHYR1_013323 [Brachionus plicatilis]|uniref:Uncharacterized protein n=1 Tax=Brachionus plicatilis TaxID=10195 RepID=A0A3M7QT46_BRAPC|nr:hypothetical protein BpHYR1_013323 [Brachionus plicatilis]
MTLNEQSKFNRLVLLGLENVFEFKKIKIGGKFYHEKLGSTFKIPTPRINKLVQCLQKME